MSMSARSSSVRPRKGELSPALVRLRKFEFGEHKREFGGGEPRDDPLRRTEVELCAIAASARRAERPGRATDSVDDPELAHTETRVDFGLTAHIEAPGRDGDF